MPIELDDDIRAIYEQILWKHVEEVKPGCDVNVWADRCQYDPSARDNYFYEPLSPLELLVRSATATVEEVEVLCNAGADVIATHPETGSTPFDHAVAFGLPEIAVGLLNRANQRRGQLDQQDAQGNTALHHAARSGDSKTITTLIANGAQCSIKNLQGATPLLLAYLAGQKRIVSQMLDMGAEQVNVVENLPAEIQLQNAVRRGALGTVMKLIGHRKKARKDQYGRLLVEIALEAGHTHVAHYLIKIRAPIERIYGKYLYSSPWLAQRLAESFIKKREALCVHSTDLPGAVIHTQNQYKSAIEILCGLSLCDERAQSVQALIKKLERSSPCWHFIGAAVPLSLLDRRKGVLNSPLFTSATYPWPFDKHERLLTPICQIDLREASQISGEDFGDEWLQLWADGLDGLLRLIPRSVVEHAELDEVPPECIGLFGIYDPDLVAPSWVAGRWSHPVATQLIGFGYPDFSSSNSIENDLQEIAEGLPEQSTQRAVLENVMRLAGKCQPNGNTLRGTFYENQYDANEYPPALLCFNGDADLVWGEGGSAQVFYEKTPGERRPEFSFQWSYNG